MASVGGGIRAFETVPVIERLVQGQSKTKVSCVESWEDSLWIGTTDGWVVYYSLEQGVSPTGRVTYRCGLQKNERILVDKPITSIQVAPVQQKLLILCNNELHLRHMHTLVTIPGYKIIKNVALMCRNEGNSLRESDAFDLTIYNGKKSLLQYEFSGTHLTQHKDLKDLDGSAYTDIVAMKREGNMLFVAQRGMYKLLNMKSEELTELIPYDEAGQKPLIKRLKMGEFLLTAGAGGATMGVFVNARGEPTQPPVQWVEPPTIVGYMSPYILSTFPSLGMMTVHSVLDQQMVQALQYQNLHVLSDTDERLVVASLEKVSLICPVPFDTQINELLSENRVREALALAEVTFSQQSPEDMDSEEIERKKRKIQMIERKAGFALLKAKSFSEALSHLAASNADPREVICLFPGLLSTTSSFRPLENPDHGIKTVESITNKDKKVDTQFRNDMIDYLKVLRNGHIPRDWRPDIDSALAILFASVGSKELVAFVSGPNKCVIEHVGAVLPQMGCFHASAILSAQNGKFQEALDMWKSLADGTLKDSAFTGVEYIIEFLTQMQLDDRMRLKSILFQHLPWVLKISPHAVSVFIKRADSRMFQSDEVLDFLRPFPEATLTYLEFLVFDQNSESELYHTKLAMIYLDGVLRKRLEVDNKRRTLGHADETAVVEMRKKLKTMLQRSDFYRVDLILERIRETDLHVECAIVYGKQGQHEKALDILVRRLGDHAAAEQYCHDNTIGKDRTVRQSLFLSLLKVYLHPEPGRMPYTKEALALLNGHIADVDVGKVVQLLPPDWSIGVIEKFLRRSIRTDIHHHRTSEIKRNLAKSSLIQVKAELTNLTSKRVVIDESTRCSHCRAALARSNGEALPFVIYPNGVVVCRNCGKDRKVCPVPSGK